ncbi:hypothetical protein [Sphingomonas sp. CFBP 8760]|uniref:hypothetical protein n=1 Tax=Sphingomonas sp. CFBP 8760 TaxID=2775282 RepID=UPI001A935F59|nr:hypothetical protein [Sphingomonas sp. CFBP 8760]
MPPLRHPDGFASLVVTDRATRDRICRTREKHLAGHRHITHIHRARATLLRALQPDPLDDEGERRIARSGIIPDRSR